MDGHSRRMARAMAAVVVGVVVSVGAFAGLSVASADHRVDARTDHPRAGVATGPRATSVVRFPAPSPVAAPDRADDFRGRFGDSASVVVMDSSGTWRVGGPEDPRAWSTLKPLLAAAVLSDAPKDGLSPDEADWLTAALSWSDNDAAAMLLSDLADRHGSLEAGAARADDLLRRAGDGTTTVVPDPESMGDTAWPLVEQARFWSALASGCLLDADGTATLLDLLGHVVEEQAWGLGRIGASAYKGGWELAEDGTWLVRQVGLVPVGDGAAVVAMAMRGPAGDLAEVTPALDQIAAWVGVQLAGPQVQSPCG